MVFVTQQLTTLQGIFYIIAIVTMITWWILMAVVIKFFRDMKDRVDNFDPADFFLDTIKGFLRDRNSNN